ncbi:MAG TPA: c-type cytochrome [Acidobacteriaceae bacterium]|nr:c-type cytochrome [Acidobacteriaceae bacterium]
MKTPGKILVALLLFASLGCNHLPGKPGFRPETQRPDQTHDFATLYKTNCSACHGDNGRNGPALPLNNPVYLAWAGHDAIQVIVSNGVPHRLMPAFGAGAGGLLTAEQVEDIVDGMIKSWGKPDVLGRQNSPAYNPGSPGDATQGQAVFQRNCAQCHGADGKGVAGGPPHVTGSIVDPSYLALISSRGLRDVIVAGIPEQKMPDWRGESDGKPMTDREVTDVVAWLVSQRTPHPGTTVTPADKRKDQAAIAPVQSRGRR